MTKERNPFKIVQAQFDHNAEVLGLDPALREFMREPERELKVRIPVDMDDGTTKTFTGFRVQHSSARGPAKGGIRFAEEETIDNDGLEMCSRRYSFRWIKGRDYC
jgi:glutamate dehydrogenase (NAD(P)+)